jgi:deoxyribonuclease IV
MVLGAHCSTAGGLSRALERAESIGASSCQIFVKNNMQWFGKPYAPGDVDRYRAQHARSNLKHVFGHAGYLINLAAAPSDNRDKSIKSLIQEVQLATTIDLPFLVLHPGAHLGDGEDTGVERVVAALDEVFRITKASSVRIALENTAGQGSCLGCELKHLAAIFDKVDRPERLGVCLDTAHFLAAGYEIRQPKGWDAAIEELDRLIGLKQILAFHLNDSKTELGSRVDRHAHIGQGKIGLEAFRYILNDARFESHPGCLETPKSDDLHEDVENLRVLRSLVERREDRPRVKQQLPSAKPSPKPPATPKQKKSKRP